MRRLFVLVEGVTEERFVNSALAPYLGTRGFAVVSAKLMGSARQRSGRGGGRAWGSVKRDIVLHLRQDSGVVVTTMVDYYGMPTSKSRAWPARLHAKGDPEIIESAMLDEITREESSARSRFVPYVVMHDFEALLFSDCGAYAEAIGAPHLGASLQAIRDSFGNPEEINDSPDIHPAQRVLDLWPTYEKVLHGERAAQRVGLDQMRAECPHFGGWLERVEAVAP